MLRGIVCPAAVAAFAGYELSSRGIAPALAAGEAAFALTTGSLYVWSGWHLRRARRRLRLARGRTGRRAPG